MHLERVTAVFPPAARDPAHLAPSSMGASCCLLHPQIVSVLGMALPLSVLLRLQYCGYHF